MNCQYFESIINDLARDQVINQAARVRAIAHASVCARCSTRLADERMLTAGLRRLSASADAEEAPAQVEARLLQAFREQRPARVSVMPARARRWPLWVAGAAAAILILFALAATRFYQSRAVTSVEQAKEVKPDQPMAAPDKTAPDKITPAKIAPDERQHALAISRKPRPAEKASRRNVVANQTKSPARPAGSDTAGEIATDFIPLMRGDGMAFMESGQIVRVELPRTALASFGLPVNMERADESIKADVVVGNDGLARAIRFVR